MPKPKPEWVRNFEAALADYYKEPVRPVSHYCNAFRTWRRCLIDSVKRGEMDNVGLGPGGRMGGQTQAVIDALNSVELPIVKSNLLWRLIYAGEEPRTEPCPIHQGHWSGCYPEPCPAGCSHGMDYTGWLPEGDSTDDAPSAIQIVEAKPK